MADYTRVEVGCLLVGEYVVAADLPPRVAEQATPIPFGEAEKVVVVGTYIDSWTKADKVREP
jgi:hypothetical protein